MADHIGVTGNAFKRGVPSATIGWTGGGGARAATIFTKIDKTPLADVAETRDNTNELAAFQMTNRRIQLKFSAKPMGNNVAAAQAILADLPLIKDPITITCADDSQVAGTAYVDDVSGSYSPEGDAIIELTCTKFTGKTFITLS